MMDKQSKIDMAIILGAGVYESQRRANYASEILSYSQIPIILTGGIPKKICLMQNPHGKSEAEIMEEILYKKGINSERISKETKSQNTLENFTYSKEIIEKLNPKEIALVDGLVHIKRSLKIARETLPEYNFTGFPVPINYKNIFMNLTIEGISKMLELTSTEPCKYRFYNNVELRNRI
jgi:uncharacterized SAM-binding protein YcdF (DUF218 family)